MPRLTRALLLTFLAVLPAACGGSSGVDTPLVPDGSAGNAAAYTRPKVTARLVIHVPRHRHHRRGERFISPSTKSIVVTTQETSPTAGSAVKSFTNIGPGAPNCNGSGSNLPYTCTVSIGNLTAGATYSLTFVTYDAAQTSAGGPYNGHALAQNTVSKRIVSGVDNTIGVVLDGVPASFSIALANSATFAGNVADGLYFGFLDSPLLVVNALDEDGNYIVGPGSPAITASIAGGATGGLAIAPSGAPNRYTASATNPGTGTLQLSAPIPGSNSPLAVNVPLTAGTLTTTVAGSVSTSGTTDGTGSHALFSLPDDMAYNPVDGNLYISDRGNCTVREMNPTTYAVTTYVGDPHVCISQDGTGAGASGALLDGPTGIAADNSGNLYVNDSGDDAIRKIAPGGVTTTIVGPDDTTAFTQLAGLTYDPDDGNLYAVDFSKCIVDRITMGGTVTVIAGISGTCDHSGSDLFGPRGIAYAGSGTLFVADTENCAIRRITNIDTSTPPATIDTVAHPFAGGNTTCVNSADGVGTAAKFVEPYYLKYDAAHNLLYLNDTDANSYGGTVRRIDVSSATVTTIAGNRNVQYAHADGWNPIFYNNEGITYDPTLNRTYISDPAANIIEEIRL